KRQEIFYQEKLDGVKALSCNLCVTINKRGEDNMKKFGFLIMFISLAVVMGACSSNAQTTVKVGISGSDTTVWDFVAEKAKEKGINVEIVRFSDYVQPNLALAEGELDANAFQTVSYFDAF